ncbi:BURP domain protein RD22-like [Coffea eugenioides]|uniref:BURP domain protein RD22-like n=1 Tax=Coffea eugenioides TaxID=49369 RepID=UPI000F60A227|nr:BURP domain protein RD22-like [Coffea eugenioides]
MELLKLLHICTFLSLAVVASHADLDIYWKSKLPNTPMPKAVRDILHSEWLEDKSTSVAVGKGGVNVNTGKGKPAGSGTHVGVGHQGVGVTAGKPQTNVGVGKGGVIVHTGHKGRPVYVGVTPSRNPFIYVYAATEDQLHDNPNVALFFLKKDLHRGTSMNLQFVKSSNPATFLPRKVADSIPFSSKSIPEIFDKFSVKPESVEAETIKNTIKECEEPGIKGEDKYCATSLESMVDFSTSKLGNNVQAVSTEAKEDTKAQKYGIVGVKKLNNNKAVVCHKQNYAYAVFYCHSTQATEAYEVTLVGADGKKAKAVAVCHEDTAKWNPKHLAFQVLKVKPGTVPICHFLPEDHVVWVPKN